MKKLLLSIALIGVAITLGSCSQITKSGLFSNNFTLLGAIIDVSPVSTESDEASEADENPPVTTVSVTYDLEDKTGEVTQREIASGRFVDGKVELRGRIAARTKITINVTSGEAEPLKQSAWIEPNGIVSFAVLEGGYAPELLVRGTYLDAKDDSSKFIISGDLSHLDGLRLETASVSIFATDYDENGEQFQKVFGHVLLDNGSFKITADVDYPTLARARLKDRGDTYETTRLILEPGIEYKLDQFPGDHFLVVTTTRNGLHKELIQDIMLDPESISLYEQYRAAGDQYAAEMENARMEQETEVSEEVSEAPTVEPPNVAFAENNPAAPECQHVDLTAVLEGIGIDPVDEAEGEQPEYIKISNQIEERETTILQKALRKADDPRIGLLIIDVGAFRYDDMEGQLNAYKMLRTKFKSIPADVEKRISGQINLMSQRLAVEQNDKSVIPGQLAPRFTLANFEGDEVSLHSVLQENEMVLVDFWASWCGPCIASFPALKKMYAAYQNMGFEIIGISIDSTMDAWEGGLEDNDLPWINLAEIGGWNGPVATNYGVNFIPKGFLIDNERCITQKDLPTSKLEKVLSGRYGEMPPVEDSESTEI